MILYSWTALNDRESATDGGREAAAGGGPGARSGGGREAGGTSGAAAGSPVAMGVTDDRRRAMNAGEEILGSGRAAVVIIEAVRPAMAAHTLAPCYTRTGVGWLGRRTPAGKVVWQRFFLRADQEDQPGPGRMKP
jgi:hypothetical protein